MADLIRNPGSSGISVPSIGSVSGGSSGTIIPDRPAGSSGGMGMFGGNNPSTANSYEVVSGGSDYDPISQTPVETINDSSKTPREQQATIAAAGTVLPIVYGRQRLGPKIAGLFVGSGFLYVVCLWCEGPIDSIDSLTMDDLPLPGGVFVNNYLGTAAQVFDPVLAAYYATMGITYADDMKNVCYSIFAITPGITSGFPRFNAIINGRTVAPSEGGTPVWSDNPALCLADFITNTRYGMGREVDWASVAATAAACDFDIGGGEKKRRLNFTLEKAQPATEWLQVLRDYAGCWCVPEGPKYRLVPDIEGTSVKSFGPEEIIEDSLNLSVKGTKNIPTVVEVVFMQTGEEFYVLPWREDSITVYAPGVLEGTVPPRRTRINKPGITTRSEAWRYGNERLNEGLYNNRHLSFKTFDEGITTQVGDIVDLTHPKGLINYELRVHSVTPVEAGRWVIAGVGYAPEKYNYESVPNIPPINVGIPNGSVYSYRFQDTQLLTNMTMFYDWFMRRYWVTDMAGVGDTWDDFFPDPMEDYVLPLWTYHTPGESRLKTETHDFGAILTGAWGGSQTYMAVSGTVFPEFGVSKDNSVFNYFSLNNTVTATGRYGNLQNYCFTTSTLYITWLGEEHVSVRKMTESGSVHTSATVGTIVKFSRMYATIISALLTPISSTAQSGTVDRLLVNNEANNVMQYNSNIEILAGSEERTFYNNGYTVVAGDFLEYDVRIPLTNGPLDSLGGINVYNAGNTSNISAAGCDDQNSDDPRDWPSGTLAYGTWYHRKIDLTNFVGETTGDFCVVDRTGAVGLHTALYNNIKITDGIGGVQLTIYVGPNEPPLNVQKAAINASGAVGQANSMTVYLFDAGGIQVEGDATWAIEGVL